MDNRIKFPPAPPARLHWAGYLLGFSAGGFFDGILLHQILQWHHLLSGMTRAPFTNLRGQILVDGLFHAAMYVIAAIGILKLLQARYVLVDRSADRLLFADFLIGFGFWHVLDAVLSHWILGLHRIRMDVPNPLLWDVLWFVVFGLAFLALGLALRWHKPSSYKGRERRSKARSTFAPMLALTVTTAALASTIPPLDKSNTRTVTVLLRPSASPAQLLAGLQEIDGRILWSSAKGDVWMFSVNAAASALPLYKHGALLISGTLLPAGCTAWVRT